jgi:hypothetical protein
MGTGYFNSRWLVAGVAFAALPSPVWAQDTGDADTMIVVVEHLSFFRVQDLSFGDILPSTAAGQVRVTPDGARTATGGVTLVGVGDHQPARFAGRGVYNRLVRIRLLSNTIQLTGPGAPMTVSQFEIGSTPNTNILTTSWTQFRIGATNGMFNFPVGARLNVNANQQPGTYSGTFSLTLEYQ